MSDVMTRRVTLTEAAARRVATLIGQDGNPGMMLRLSVNGGGCSGFSYGITLDDTVTADDLVFQSQGVKVVVDEVSLGYIDGAEIDFTENLMGAAFAVNNPNATASCGCGSSFSV